MAAGNKEGLQWIMTLMNTLYSVFDTLGKVSEKVPDQWKQRLPGFMGWSLEDERIFDGILGQLKNEEQVIISNFLFNQCKEFERNRFINVVAGMEVVPAKPEEKETRWSEKTGGVVFEKTKAGSPGVDCRKIFLEKFASLIKNDFGGDLQKAYDFCISGRIIIPDPMHQKAKRSFNDLTQKVKNASTDFSNDCRSFRERARIHRQNKRR
ncbi:MAG TPA: hypothetical protein P5548_02095 [Candidatus Moranbacteria bacterium]|nr:hypothetical protein [Candidatus Moranbacteria bacterium]HRZ33664.1 hypothetical protein [Candidatus Moranbacteria bacterium]